MKDASDADGFKIHVSINTKITFTQTSINGKNSENFENNNTQFWKITIFVS